MRQIVRHAAKVKKKRGEGGVKAASIKTDKWHRWAYDQALDQRARFPTRSRTGIANAIHEKDVQGGSPIIPSWDSLYDTLADWEKGKRLPEGFGTLAKKSV